MLPKYEMAARGEFQKILWAQKLLKLEVRNYSNFTITFHTIWRCAGDFVKVLLKFKMAATDQLQFFWWEQKFKKLVSSFFFNFNITFLARCGCASYFLKMQPNSKWPPEVNSTIFCGRKNLKLHVRDYSNFRITFPTIWRCAGDFFKVSKWLPWINFNSFKVAKTQKL